MGSRKVCEGSMASFKMFSLSLSCHLNIICLGMFSYCFIFVFGIYATQCFLSFLDLWLSVSLIWECSLQLLLPLFLLPFYTLFSPYGIPIVSFDTVNIFNIMLLFFLILFFFVLQFKQFLSIFKTLASSLSCVKFNDEPIKRIIHATERDAAETKGKNVIRTGCQGGLMHWPGLSRDT